MTPGGPVAHPGAPNGAGAGGSEPGRRLGSGMAFRPGELPGAPTWRGRERRGGGWVRLAVAGLLLLLAASWFTDLLPSFGNPFASETVDRSQPTLLQALEDLSEYRAAVGQFQVIVDVEEDSVLPSIVSGERTVFLAGGNVAASVDFSGLDADAIEVSDDGTSVHITLPRARLSDAVVEPERSYVVNRERGLLDRLGAVLSDNPTSERDLYLLAEDKLAVAAADAGLVERAEENTEEMLGTLLRSLGYERVTVEFSEETDARR